ncbi:MAG: ABC transporter substrate-binding protein [Desulfohalobiaceae bacterium]|nr:ABC transporter substrate-binding protein [Desulfohalobiaceae bacterium]
MSKKHMHPGIYDLKSQLDSGKISRREFIRYAALIGVSVTAATQMAGLTWPGKAFAGEVKRGGTMKVSAPVQKVTHPAQFSWIVPSNQMRQVAEYLTFTDANNVTHPYLLKNWEASDDLMTWTLNMRQGIMFNNGDEFTSDDVIFTMQQWLDEDVGSSMLGMMKSYLDPTGIEKVDKYQVKLHLKRPEIAIPEHMFHYPALVLNSRTFEGDFIKKPHGTGPFTLEMFREGERCALKRRNDYWKKGEDGKPQPYLDSVQFIDMGAELAAQIAALQSGETDSMDMSDLPGPQAYKALKDDPDIKVMGIATNSARVLRMRVDVKPWDDNRVRQALKLCQHREKILGLAYYGEGLIGQDVHVSPMHPEYCKIETPKYDPERARQLLKEAGYPDGLEVDLNVGSGWNEIVRYAEILKEDAKPAGLTVNIKTMPNSQYWEKWTEVGLGVTVWAHRPLGTMVLNLGYTTDAEGKPVAWNETNWSDKEFAQLLEEANGTLDVDKRRKIFCKLEQIQQDRGSIGIPFWINQWTICGKNVENLNPHPTMYMYFNDVWLSS